MASTAILFPSIAMALLTLGMIGYMGFSRDAAVRKREVNFKHYQLYNVDQEPDHLRVITRHVQNHFEVPPLFHFAVLLTYATGTVTTLAVALAWGYFAARCAHSYVHLGSNVVMRRFYVFGVSLLFLVLLWLHLLVQVVRS